MRKRLVLIGLGTLAIVVGMAAFAANTAEWVNVLAHVEKEIQLACVDEEGLVVRDDAGVIQDCDYGTVFPQSQHTKRVELTLSRSYLEGNHDVIAIAFDVLWECKLADEFAPASETNPCRNEEGGDLDGNIRDYISVASDNDASCFRQRDVGPGPGSGFEDGGAAQLEYLNSGVLNENQMKCFYTLTLDVPACAGHVNPETDPDPAATLLDCNEDFEGDDPQQWDVSADLGDNFKVQVFGVLED